MTDILRVYLCGAHSTGKTTLLEDLKPLLHLHAYTNVARDIMQKSGLDREKIDYKRYPAEFKNLQEKILKHLLDIDDESLACGKDYICDRGIDPLIYAYVYLGEEVGKSLQELSFVEEFIGRLRKSLLFVLLPHKECLSDDGIRMLPDLKELELFTDRMLSLLEDLKIPHKVIKILDRRERQRQVVEEVSRSKPHLVKT